MSIQFKPDTKTEKQYDTYAKGEKHNSLWAEKNSDIWRLLDQELAKQGEP